MTKTQQPVTTPKNQSRELTGLVTVWVFALIPANLVPTIIGRLVREFDVGLTTAGAVATAMTLANAAAVLGLRRAAVAGYRKSLTITGALIVIISLGAAVVTMTAPVIMTALILGGFGSGMIVAASSAAVSGLPDPEKATNVVMIINRLAVAIIFFIIPIVSGDMRTVMLLIIIPGVFALIGSAWMPVEQSAQPLAETDQDQVLEDGAIVPPRQILFEGFTVKQVKTFGWIFALAWGVSTITDDGVFGLVEIIAEHNVNGADAEVVALMLGVATLAGMLGAMLTLPALKKIGYLYTLGGVLVLSIVAKLMLTVSSSATIFFIGGCLWDFCFGATIPVVFGFAALMARDGSISVLINGIYVIGVALGPFVGTQVHDALGVGAVATSMSILAVVSAAVMLYVVHRAHNARTQSTTTPPPLAAQSGQEH